MTWQEQYIEELKKEIEYNRKIHMDYFSLLCKCRLNDPEIINQIELLTNPFAPNKTPAPRHEYKVGDVLMRRWNFNIARIIKIEGDWYYFDRRGMNEITECYTHVHKNSVEPEYCTRKVDIDLPANILEEKYEVKGT